MLNKYHYRLSFLVLSLALLVALLVTSAFVAQAASEPLAGQMDVGSSGANVRNLQSFLAGNPLLYPEALVTGYYGPLTQSAVAQFQIAYGLPAVGRVGPMTLAKINSIISSGAPLDVSAPTISNVQASGSVNGVTLSWSTSEQTNGVVYYSPDPIVVLEVNKALTAPVTSGTAVVDQNSSTSHSVPIAGLLSNKTYHYVVHATDLTGNVSITNAGSFTSK